MVTVSTRINRPLDVVWGYFTTVENWSKWYGGEVKEVKPTWQRGAKLVWSVGGESPIVKFVPCEEVSFSGPSLDTTYKFEPDGRSATIVKVSASDPKGGAALNERGAAQKAQWESVLQSLKIFVEEDTRI